MILRTSLYLTIGVSLLAGASCADEDTRGNDPKTFCTDENSVLQVDDGELAVWFEGAECARYCEAAERLCNAFDGDDWLDYNACRGTGEGVEYLCDHAWSPSACRGRCVAAAGGTCGVAAIYACAEQNTCEDAQRCMEERTQTLWRGGTSYACESDGDACPDEGPLSNHCDSDVGLCVVGSAPGPAPVDVPSTSLAVYVNVPTPFALAPSHPEGGAFFCRVDDDTSLRGVVLLEPDGAGTFEPELDFRGPTTFTAVCALEDGAAASAPATITFDVVPHPETRPPTVMDQTLTLSSGSNGVVDPMPSHPEATSFRYDIPTTGPGAPEHVRTWTRGVTGIGVAPVEPSFVGTDTFSFRVMPTTGGVWSAWAEVSVTVTE